ncbi:MAG: hypothetical protein ACU843_14765 [Gammaproteobacteria bacterium]
MSKQSPLLFPSVGAIYTKETLKDGTPISLQCIDIGGQTFAIQQGLLTVASLEDEWYEDLDNPQLTINALQQNSDFKADLFTFWQRLPDKNPMYHYHMEWDNIAALRIESYDYWWNKQIKSNTRGHVRKAQKKGIVIKECAFDDDFIRGMVDIFNETPVRQNRRFWHYGKDFDTVKREFSRYLFREQLLGAYYDNELIGFIMLADAGRYAILGQIISKISHRDKNSTNALIAKSIEICADQKVPYLVYAHWPTGTLADFKQQNGFEKIELPRYYVPLTKKGELALKWGLHREWKTFVPDSVKGPLKKLRSMFYQLNRG